MKISAASVKECDKGQQTTDKNIVDVARVLQYMWYSLKLHIKAEK